METPDAAPDLSPESPNVDARTPDPEPRPTARTRATDPISRRLLVAIGVAWTLGCGGWFGSVALDGRLDTSAVTLAVGGMVGTIWLLGLLIVVLIAVPESTPDVED